MNNDELKKKIVDIIQMKLQECPFQPIGITYGEAAEYVADALIAAKIGDVKEANFEADHYWNMWQGACVELERAEHRAEVAERALREACSRAWSIECTCPSIFEDNDECSECYKNQSEKRYEEKDTIDCLGKKLLEQAEKELAEERKDD